MASTCKTEATDNDGFAALGKGHPWTDCQNWQKEDSKRRARPAPRRFLQRGVQKAQSEMVKQRGPC